MKSIFRPNQPILFLLLVFSLFFFAACGDGGSDSANTASTGNTDAAPGDAVATMPAPKSNFAAVGQQSVLTDTANLTQTQAAKVNAPAADLALGQRAYEKNKCADCHGAQGEGVANKGKAIAGTALSATDFDKVLRTGGGLGNTHIFGRSAVSPNGMNALYAFVQSLK